MAQKGGQEMSKKAEQRALEAYPVKMVDGPIGYEESVFDFNALCRHIFQEGYEQAEKDLSWHPSTEHPPVDEEVIVLKDHLNLNCFYQIAFGHIVNKDIAVDYDGWNIEGVRYWMPCPEIPKEK